MKKILNIAYENKNLLLMFVFIFLSALCIFMKSDDFIWYYIYEMPELEFYKVPNGRYFSNIITHIGVRIPLLRSIFYIAVLFFMLIFIGKIIGFNHKNKQACMIFGFFMFLIIPSDSYAEVINWFSGFTNYALSFLLTSIYIFFCLKIAFTEYNPPKYMMPVMLVLAVLGGLCVEHVSIYNICFSIFAIILIKYKRKKIYPVNICYAVGSVVGFALMMTNGIYMKIFETEDFVGSRKFSFALTDMYMGLIKNLMPHYASTFWIANLIITFSLFVLYTKSEKKYKYGKLCMYICIFYSAYSLFVSCFDRVESMNDAYKVNGVECAFTFLYIISLIYLIVKLVYVDSAIRCVLYVFSTAIVSFPFIIASPITARCMFTNYMFWILLAGELFFNVIEDTSSVKIDILKDVLFMLSVVICFIISCFNFTNNYYNKVRFNYIREQLDSNSKIIRILDFPYPKYGYDPYFDINLMFAEFYSSEKNYFDLYFEYYGLNDIKKEEHIYSTLSPADYNRLKEID